MTKEEAIAYGKDYYRDLTTACCDIDEKHKGFVRMSLKALSQEPTIYPPCEDCRKKMDEIRRAYDRLSEQEPCDDAISQNQSNACSILDDECPYPHKHCWECPLHYQYELAKHELDKNVDLPSVTQKSEHFIDGVHAMGYREGYKDAQKQKSGKWIKKEDNICWWYVCSECGQEPLKNRWNDDDVLSTFCPNCGAKMESEE